VFHDYWPDDRGSNHDRSFGVVILITTIKTALRANLLVAFYSLITGSSPQKEKRTEHEDEYLLEFSAEV